MFSYCGYIETEKTTVTAREYAQLLNDALEVEVSVQKALIFCSFSRQVLGIHLIFSQNCFFCFLFVDRILVTRFRLSPHTVFTY